LPYFVSFSLFFGFFLFRFECSQPQPKTDSIISYKKASFYVLTKQKFGYVFVESAKNQQKTAAYRLPYIRQSIVGFYS